MPDARAELFELTKELKARLRDSDESEWTKPESPARPAGQPSVDPAARMRELAAEIDACRRCPLGSTRIKTAPGVGDVKARVMFIGEGPGYEEDRKGEPFVGKAGQLLDKILASIGLSRETVFIANIVKCHPMKNPGQPEARGNDRPPTPEEAAACRPFLDEQIGLVNPRIIVTLGATAIRSLMGEDVSITRIRGQWREYRPAQGAPIRLLPTYHPAALLRNPDLKKDVWEDMKSLRRELAA